MFRSSSMPKFKLYSRGSNKLPKIEKNRWLTNSSDNSESYDYLNDKRNLPEKYSMNNRDISNAVSNIDNNYYRKINKNNPFIYDQLNAMERNYNQMKLMLNDKINRLEHNQRKVKDFLKYSLEQDRLQNDINTYKFNNYLKNYHEKNLNEKDYLLNMLNEVPNLIEKKLGKLYHNEMEENRNQKYFLENLKQRMSLELQRQRRYDYLRYKRQLNEMIELKNNEEKEKMRLYHQIQRQKMMYRMQAINFQNQFYQYQALNILPLYQFMQNQNNKNSSLGLDELIKVLLFKHLLGNNKFNEDTNRRKERLIFDPKITRKRYRKNSYGSGNSFSSSLTSRTKSVSKISKKENKKSTKLSKTSKKSKSNKTKSSAKSSSPKSSGNSSEEKTESKKDDEKSENTEENKKDDEKSDKNTEESKKDDEKSDKGSDNDDGEKDDEDGDGDGDGDGDEKDDKDDKKEEGQNQQTYQMPPSYQNPT